MRRTAVMPIAGVTYGGPITRDIFDTILDRNTNSDEDLDSHEEDEKSYKKESRLRLRLRPG